MEFLKKWPKLYFILLLGFIFSFKIFSSGTYHLPYKTGVKANYTVEEIKKDAKSYFDAKFVRFGLNILGDTYYMKEDKSIIYDYRKISELNRYDFNKIDLKKYEQIILKTRKPSHKFLGISDYKIKSIKETCRNKNELCFRVVVEYRDVKDQAKEILELHYFDKFDFYFQQVTQKLNSEKRVPGIKIYSMLEGMRKGPKS